MTRLDAIDFRLAHVTPKISGKDAHVEILPPSSSLLTMVSFQWVPRNYKTTLIIKDAMDAPTRSRNQSSINTARGAGRASPV